MTVLFIRAAFDASMDHPKRTETPVTAVAGYVGNVDAWEAVEPLWNEQLLKVNLGSFRLNDIRKNFRDDSWMDVVRPFAEIIQDADLISVAGSLWDADWLKADHPPEYLEICPRRQHACLDILLNPLAEVISLDFEKAPTVLVFDNDFESREAIIRVQDAWCERTGNPKFDLFLKGDFPWDAVPLQCADMLAGLMRLDTFYREWLRSGSADIPSDSSMLFNIAGMARAKRGRGALWSSAIGEKVEEL